MAANCCWRYCSNSFSGNAGSRRISATSFNTSGRLARVVSMLARARSIPVLAWTAGASLAMVFCARMNGGEAGRWLVAGLFGGVLLSGAAGLSNTTFFNATPRGPLTFPQLLPIPEGSIVFVVTAFALTHFALTERFERRRAEA